MYITLFTRDESAYNLPSYFLEVHFNITFHLCLSFPNVLLSSGCPTKSCMNLTVMRVTAPPVYPAFDRHFNYLTNYEYKAPLYAGFVTSTSV